MKYKIDKNIRPAYLQIYKQIKDDIINGNYPYNTKLPSKRFLADETETSTIPVEPAIKPACLTTKSGVVGVVATERSLAGEKFLNTLARYGDGVRVIKSVGRGFVEAVERDAEQEEATEQAVKAVIEPIIEQGADIIVLGCTHYPFLRGVIEKVVAGRNVQIIDSGEAVGKRVESLLDKYDLRAAAGHSPQYEFMTFADEEYRKRLERKAFGR